MPIPHEVLSGGAVVGIIGAISTLVVGIIGKLKVDQARNQSNDVTIKRPVPTVETREKPVLAIKADVDSAIKRIEDQHNKCQQYQGEQRANIHHRLDDQVKALARMEGTLASVQQTTSTLLDLALQKKPSPRQ